MMKNPENLYYSSFKIAGLNFKIISSQKGIKEIFINDKERKLRSARLTKLHPDDPYMFNVFTELEEYFNLTRKKFTVPLELIGSEFQKRVWKELLQIPYGKTVSYKEIANKVGGETYIRAVGKANGSNSIPIIIPCHRVINSNGKIGGFSLGISLKQKLLELEGSLSLELFEKR